MNVMQKVMGGVFETIRQIGAPIFARRKEAFMAAPQGIFGGGPVVGIQRALGGKKPVACDVLVIDDGTGSGKPWAAGIEKGTEMVVRTLTAKLAAVSFGYTVSRDRDVGEADEQRLANVDGDQLLREQKLIVRDGGGDPEETFGDSVMDAVSGYPFNHASDVSRAIVLLTTSNSKPTAAGLAPFQVGEEVAKRKIYLFVVGEPGSNVEDMVKGAGKYGGGFFHLSLNPSQAEVDQMAARLTATIMGTVSNPAAGTVPTGTVRPSGTIRPSGMTVANP